MFGVSDEVIRQRSLITGLVGPHVHAYQNNAEFKMMIDSIARVIPPIVETIAVQTEANHEEMVKRIEQVMKGQLWVDPDV